MSILASQQEIVGLHDYPAIAPLCATWSYEEWGRHVGDRSLAQVITSYEGYAENHDSLPQTWINLVEGKPTGMVSLRLRGSHPDVQNFSPWLASLFVYPAFRGIGIGKRLCSFVVQEAGRYGYRKVYLFTGAAKDFYLRLGWKQIGTVTDPMKLLLEGDALMEIETYKKEAALCK